MVAIPSMFLRKQAVDGDVVDLGGHPGAVPTAGEDVDEDVRDPGRGERLHRLPHGQRGIGQGLAIRASPVARPRAANSANIRSGKFQGVRPPGAHRAAGRTHTK
ncbi:hypothetical protein ACIQV3_01855 [Streptomyces sp. NPDC099050]|uniref:hypothetical protein n=1 Tax=Streptomyces sp. NPDC099050 TaxID=3366100 RepID=UPI0037F1AD7D